MTGQDQRAWPQKDSAFLLSFLCRYFTCWSRCAFIPTTSTWSLPDLCISFLRASVNWEALKIMEIYFLTVEETGSTKSRCQHGWFLREVVREKLLHASPSFSFWWTAGNCFLGFPGLYMLHSNFCFFIWLSPVCVCVLFL